MTASEWLRDCYNAFAKDGEPPTRMEVSPELYHAYDDGLIALVRQKPAPIDTSVPFLHFRAARVYVEPTLPFWSVRAFAHGRRAVAYLCYEPQS